MDTEKIDQPSPGETVESIRDHLFGNYETLRQIKTLSQNGDFDPEVGDALWRLADKVQQSLDAIYEF